MTTRRLAQAFGLCVVAALGLFLIVASNPSGGNQTPPAAPTLLSLEIPSNALGNGFAGVMPTLVATATTPANYSVLPLLPTTAPIVRVVLDTPSNSTLTVTATDVNRATPTVTLPMAPASSPGPTTGYYQVLNAPSGWHIVVRYPNAFQGSKSIRTSITDTVGGLASAPLTFDMSFSGSTLMVSIVTANNDGRVTSNPPGIDCPGVCNFRFPLGEQRPTHAVGPAQSDRVHRVDGQLCRERQLLHGVVVRAGRPGSEAAVEPVGHGQFQDPHERALSVVDDVSSPANAARKAVGDTAELRKCPIRDSTVRQRRLFLLRGPEWDAVASLQRAEPDASHLLDQRPDRRSGHPRVDPTWRMLRDRSVNRHGG